MEILRPVTTVKTKEKEQAQVKAVAEKKKLKHQVKEAKVEAKEEIKANAVENAQRKSILSGLLSSKVLETNKGEYFLHGYPSVKMPELLVERFVDYTILKRDVQPLINFWMWCLLNPNKVARYKLFAYIQRHKLIVTPSGYFVTYRMVKSTDTSEETGIYVDAHTGKFQHIIGQVSKMPRKDCDEDGKNDCSRGLHTGSPDFIGISLGDGYKPTEIKTRAQGGGYGTGYAAPSEPTPQKFNNSFGNQAVICLVNPMHVVSIPNSDTMKLRSCELYIAKKTTPEEVVSHLTEVDYLVFDSDYARIESAEIEAQLKEAKLEDYSDGSVEKLRGEKGKPAKSKLEFLQNSLKSLSTKVMDDKIADDVTPEEMMKVIQSRVTQVATVITLPRSEKAKQSKKATSKVEEAKVEEPKTVPVKKVKAAPVKDVVNETVTNLVETVKEFKTKKPTLPKKDDAELAKFVVAEYEKKKKAKKSPKNFNVYRNGDGFVLSAESVLPLLGNLSELYEKYK